MEKRELSKEEIISLIGEFKSEVRKCLAKIDIYNQKIEEFTKLLGNGIENQPIIRKKEKTVVLATITIIGGLAAYTTVRVSMRK